MLSMVNKINYNLSMKKHLAIFIIFANILLQPVNLAYAEGGTSDAKTTNCGKMGCDYWVGKFFMFGDVDNFTMENGDRLPKPSKVDSIHTSIWSGGSVNFHPLTTDGKLLLGPFKVVLSGDGATFGLAPIDGVTFSADRKTVYISYVNAENKIGPSGSFQINAKNPGTISVAAYGQISEGVYSETPTDIGEIKVSSRSLMNTKVTISCVKGKTTKKITSINPVCPAGYKKK